MESHKHTYIIIHKYMQTNIHLFIDRLLHIHKGQESDDSC